MRKIIIKRMLLVVFGVVASVDILSAQRIGPPPPPPAPIDDYIVHLIVASLIIGIFFINKKNYIVTPFVKRKVS